MSVLALLAGWPRRVLAALLLALAALVWLQGQSQLTNTVERRVAVLAAAHDLGAGAVLGPADVRLVRLDPALVPAGALQSARPALGRTVAGAVRRGEPITDVRLVSRALTAGLSRADMVAVPVRLADGETASFLRAGDRVDLLATPTDPADRPAAGSALQASADSPDDAVSVAIGVRVLAVLTRPDAAIDDGALVLVATSTAAARQLAGATAHARVSVALRPP
jgi:Flp pilus assembly protein CpaB